MAKRSTSGGSSGRRGSSRNSSGSSSSGGRKSGGSKSFRKSDSKSSDRPYRKSDSGGSKRPTRSYGSRDGGSSEGKSSYGDRKSSFKKRDDDSSSRGKSSYRGKDSAGPRKTSYRKSDSEGGERSGERFKKFDKPYGKRDEGSSGSSRSYGNKRGGFRKDEGGSESRGRSSYGDRRDSSSSSRPRKTSYRKDSEGGERPEGRFKKPFERRDDSSSRPRKTGYRKSDSDGDSKEFKKFDKPYERRDDSAPRPRRTGGSRKSDSDGGEDKKEFKKFDKPFAKRDDSTSRPRRTSGPRKSDSDGDGDKKFEKPFVKRDEGSSDTRRPRRESGSSFRGKRNDEGIPPEEGAPVKKGRFDKFSGDDRTERPSRGRSSSSDGQNGFFKKSKTRYDAKPDRKSHDMDAPIQNEKIRLNRFIANSGVCSRREADNLIAMGLISVNGKIISEMGYKVNPGDEVRYENKVLKAEKPVYVLMNKPKGFLTTTEDPQERNTVMHIIGSNVKERIYPVGRLDRNTTGLLLLTNDGDLADKLMHPSYNAKKIYKVDLDRAITKADLQAVRDGVMLEEGRALVDDVAVVSEDGKTVGVEIHIGWNRVVRRIFESLGYEIEKLDRSVYAGLDKKELARGQWRFLTKEEIVRLKHFK
jgi:23S rRNA pseudouridine2605 synthase